MSHLHIPHIHFYPRPPRGGRPACIADRRVSSVFLSTPSARRATRRPGQEGSRVQISIHALREEGDGAFPSPMCVDRRFLSTPSARRATFHLCHHGIFPVISIHALREEGDCRTCRSTLGGRAISIHALREEGDFDSPDKKEFTFDFYPRPPRGGRPGIS